MAQDIGTQQLLDAIDGVTYVVDASGIIRAIGAVSWQRFAAQNDASALTADSMIGTSVFAGIDGADVREACERLHDCVCQGQRPAVTYEYRCDAPDVERRMRMSISPVAGKGNVVMALYQSQLLAEAPRLPLGLLSMNHRGVTTAVQSSKNTSLFAHSAMISHGQSVPDRKIKSGLRSRTIIAAAGWARSSSAMASVRDAWSVS